MWKKMWGVPRTRLAHLIPLIHCFYCSTGALNSIPLVSPPRSPPSDPHPTCVGPLAQNRYEGWVGDAKGGAGALTIVERTVFICKEKNKEHESRTRAGMQGSSGRLWRWTGGGVSLAHLLGRWRPRQAGLVGRSGEGERWRCWPWQSWEQGHGTLGLSKGSPDGQFPTLEGTGFQPQTSYLCTFHLESEGFPHSAPPLK